MKLFVDAPFRAGIFGVGLIGEFGRYEAIHPDCGDAGWGHGVSRRGAIGGRLDRHVRLCPGHHAGRDLCQAGSDRAP